jgi:hypothetical protein
MVPLNVDAVVVEAVVVAEAHLHVVELVLAVVVGLAHAAALLPGSLESPSLKRLSANARRPSERACCLRHPAMATRFSQLLPHSL